MCSKQILPGNLSLGEEFNNCLFPMPFPNKQTKIQQQQIQAKRKTKMWIIFQSYFIIWMSVFYFCMCTNTASIISTSLMRRFQNKLCKTPLSTQVLGWLELNLIPSGKMKSGTERKKKEESFSFFLLSWQHVTGFRSICKCLHTWRGSTMSWFRTSNRSTDSEGISIIWYKTCMEKGRFDDVGSYLFPLHNSVAT